MKITLKIKEGECVLDVKEAVDITLSFAKEVGVDASVRYTANDTAYFTVDVVDDSSLALLQAMAAAFAAFNMKVEVLL